MRPIFVMILSDTRLMGAARVKNYALAVVNIPWMK